ncbi:MAG: UvrD-helicase domain-containing protein [Lentimicrobiaceae bacterium]|nr:UvrD-helicase domain-containing protein [Lentimicrobiaceae bacterium]
MQNQKSFIIYEASAGSGKTFNLAKEYIKLCLTYFEKNEFIYRKILAITFTNKAVNEMKERILSFLKNLANGVEDDLFSILSQEVDKQQIAFRAKKILNHIHHDYSNFSIYTIDSFFQRIVQSFAVDLKIPLNHQLEFSDEVILYQAVDLLLSKLGHDKNITDAVLNFSFFNMDEEKSWNIEHELAKIGKQIYRESAVKYLKKLEKMELADFVATIGQLKSEIADLAKNIQTFGQKACEIITNAGLDFDDFYQGKRGIGEWFRKKAEGNLDYPSEKSYVVKAVNEDLWYSKTSAKAHRIESITPPLIDCTFDIINLLREYNLLKAVKKNIYPIALLNEIRFIVSQIRWTDKVMHISEANVRIAESIQNELIPFIFERIGDKFSYIFIDEFQDTSVLQWQNLLPIAVEAISSQTFENESGKAILFGDAKQAIYRWRGGDVGQFAALPKVEGVVKNEIIQEREGALERNFHKEFLATNWRSKKEIIAFNNAFFEAKTANSEEPQIKSIYQSIKQQTPENEKIGGGVFLSYLKKNEEKTDYAEFIFNEITGIIQTALQDNYTFADIAILVRSNDLGTAIAKHLSELQIPTISAESLLLANNREVIFLIACLTYLTDANYPIAKANILNFIAIQKKLVKEEILPYCTDGKMFIGFVQSLFPQFNPIKLQKQSLYERVEDLIQIFDLAKEANPFILAFLDFVATFTNSAAKPHVQFLDYWKEKSYKLSLSNPKGIDAVTVMTIHQAKGLEFPIVIYPFKDSRSGSDTKWVELEKPIGKLNAALLQVKDMQNTCFEPFYIEEKQLEQLDVLNIDYVAFTRAEDRLYLIGKEGNKRVDEIQTFLKNQAIEPVCSEDETVNYYQYGSKTEKTNVSKSKETKQVNALTNYLSVPLSVNFSTQEYINAERLWGTKIHAYLSQVYTKEDVEKVTKSIQNDKNLRENDKNTLSQTIKNVFSHPQAEILFRAGTTSKNEVEIIDENGKSHRIDRLVLDGTNCVLIDYKTGNPQDEHSEQINLYGNLLREADFDVVGKWLVYINDYQEVLFCEV